MISAAVAHILRQHREACNRGFAEARHRFPHLDAQAFTRFLQDDARALLEVIEQHHPDQLEPLVLAIYHHGLQLAGLRWCGVDSQFALLQDVWRYTFPHWHHLLVQAPTRSLIAITHALRQLQDHPGADPLGWLQHMSTLATLYNDVELWLQAGQVQAWWCGLAHYRESALQQADRLPEIPLLIALDAAHLQKWPVVRAQLVANHWWTPTHPPAPMTEQRRVGGLAGMGGVFTALPLVFAQGDALLVQSGGQWFELYADARGAALQRIAQVNPTPPLAPRDAGFVRNRLQVDGHARTISDINTITSVACTRDTVAVTSADSFQVIVFARGGGAG